MTIGLFTQKSKVLLDVMFALQKIIYTVNIFSESSQAYHTQFLKSSKVDRL